MPDIERLDSDLIERNTPMFVKRIELGGDYYYRCPYYKCNKEISSYYSYCPYCGQKLIQE